MTRWMAGYRKQGGPAHSLYYNGCGCVFCMMVGNFNPFGVTTQRSDSQWREGGKSLQADTEGTSSG